MMNRRSFNKKLGLGSAAMLGLSSMSWAKIMNTMGYEFTPLHGDVGFFTERGGTIGWYMAKGEAVIIDSQFPDTVVHVLDELKKKGDVAVKYLINTHHHGDHTAGNIALKGIAENVLAHTNSKINQEKNSRGGEILLPNETFDDKKTIKVGDEVISLSYYGAGHTNGDAIIHFENANIVHMGDLIFNRRFPFIDKGAGASISNWVTVLDKSVKTFDSNTKFIFGHAGEGHPVTGSTDDLKAMMNYLDKMLSMVKKKVEEKMPEEEIMKIKSVPGAEEWKGDGIERSLSAALQELKE